MLTTEVDPTFYVLEHIFFKLIGLTNRYFVRFLLFLICFTFNILATYHKAQMVLFGFSALLYVLQCGYKLLKIATLLAARHPVINEIYVLIMWFK